MAETNQKRPDAQKKTLQDARPARRSLLTGKHRRHIEKYLPPLAFGGGIVLLVLAVIFTYGLITGKSPFFQQTIDSVSNYVGGQARIVTPAVLRGTWQGETIDHKIRLDFKPGAQFELVYQNRNDVNGSFHFTKGFYDIGDGNVIILKRGPRVQSFNIPQTRTKYWVINQTVLRLQITDIRPGSMALAAFDQDTLDALKFLRMTNDPVVFGKSPM